MSLDLTLRSPSNVSEAIPALRKVRGGCERVDQSVVKDLFRGNDDAFLS